MYASIKSYKILSLHTLLLKNSLPFPIPHQKKKTSNKNLVGFWAFKGYFNKDSSFSITVPKSWSQQLFTNEQAAYIVHGSMHFGTALAS